MKYLLSIILLTLSITCFAQEPALYLLSHSFKAPTTRVDGTILKPEEIAGFNIYLNSCEMPESSANVVPPSSGEYTLKRTAREFSLTVTQGPGTYAITVVDTEGRESTQSSLIFFTAVSIPSQAIPSIKPPVVISIQPQPAQ